MIRKSFILVTLLATVTLGANSYAQGKGGHGGDGFRNTAVEYDGKAKHYKHKGKQDIAAVYARMAAIKRHAAKLADKGRWDDIDWSEYHQLEGKLATMHNNKHKKKYK